MRVYYKIICAKEGEKAAAGLGYEALFGHEGRYFATRTEAEKRTEELNNWPGGEDDLSGAYSVETRHFYNDGTCDDSDDAHCQLEALTHEA